MGSPPGLNVSTIPTATRNALLGTSSNTTVKPHPNGYYFGYTTHTPYVGDTRVTFKASTGGQASVYGEQSGSSIVPYKAASGKSLLRLDRGTLTVERMFDNATAENKVRTIILRLVRAPIVMALGIGMVLSPLEVVADIIPYVGDIVGGAISCMSASIAAVLSLIVIGIAWAANRPIISGVATSIATVGLAIIGCFIYAARQRKKNNHQIQGNQQPEQGEPDIEVWKYNQQPQMQENMQQEQGEPDIEVWEYNQQPHMQRNQQQEQGEPDIEVWKYNQH